MFEALLKQAEARPAVVAPADPARVIPKLYGALVKAETGGQPNPFIRTKVRPSGGSTAYGPAQMTGTLTDDYRKRLPELFSAAEHRYLSDYSAQAREFRRVGGMSPTSAQYNRALDYGGRGRLGDTPEQRALYARVAQKILTDMYQRSGSNVTSTVERWRGVPAAKDPTYFRRVLGSWGTAPTMRKGSAYAPSTQRAAACWRVWGMP